MMLSTAEGGEIAGEEEDWANQGMQGGNERDFGADWPLTKWGGHFW